MAKRRAPKGTFYKAADWEKLLKVKKGEEKYEIERPAALEDKELYSCGVIPFGQSASTTAGAKIHKLTTISRAGIKFAKGCVTTDTWGVFGIATAEADVVAGPAGWYPAVVTITIASTTRPTTKTTSQLSTNKYYKIPTRSGSVPFGRRTKAIVNQETKAETTTADEVDFNDMKVALTAAIKKPAAPADCKLASRSFKPEIWQPIASASAWASTIIADPGAITALIV